jgi:hypothetical protein
LPKNNVLYVPFPHWSIHKYNPENMEKCLIPLPVPHGLPAIKMCSGPAVIYHPASCNAGSILCLFYGTFHAVLHARTLYSTFLGGVRGEAAKFCNICTRLFFVFVGKLVLSPASSSKSNFTRRKSNTKISNCSACFCRLMV